jgi:hypothetical protein
MNTVVALCHGAIWKKGVEEIAVALYVPTKNPSPLVAVVILFTTNRWST